MQLKTKKVLVRSALFLSYISLFALLVAITSYFYNFANSFNSNSFGYGGIPLLVWLFTAPQVMLYILLSIGVSSFLIFLHAYLYDLKHNKN